MIARVSEVASLQTLTLKSQLKSAGFQDSGTEMLFFDDADIRQINLVFCEKK
jgi:hypothetical protein